MTRIQRSPASSSPNLSQAQKQQILAHYRSQKALNSFYSQQDLADWARITFKLSYTPSRSTIHRIINLNSALSQSPAGSTSKKKLPANTEELDRLLSEWVHTQQSKGLMVNTHLIKLQSQWLQDRLNTTLPVDQRLDLKFSNGWLEKFCNRHSFQQHIAHGEAASVQQKTINQELPAIRLVLQQYSAEDIFKADETGLFYNMPPNKTISATHASGLKKNKARISILFACNSSGTEKLDPLFIGKSQQPQAFKKRTPEQLGIQYFNNPKAWMTSSIFTTWLTSLDLYVARTPGRHILLLLDNFSGHGTPQKPLTELKNITIYFLPPNTTSRIQPLDAGIIAAFKKQYRSRQYARALLESELGSSDIYNLDILSAMQISQDIWRAISISTIRNCWRHTGLVDWEVQSAAEEDALLSRELEETLRKLTEVTIQDVVQPAGEEDPTADPEEDLGTPSPPESSVERGKGQGSPTSAKQEQLQTLQAAQDLLASHGLLTQQG